MNRLDYSPNHYVIIGVNAGYGNMKTARTMDPTGFPQGYAAMVPLMDNDKRLNGFRNFMGTVMMADIGNSTILASTIRNPSYLWMIFTLPRRAVNIRHRG